MYKVHWSRPLSAISVNNEVPVPARELLGLRRIAGRAYRHTPGPLDQGQPSMVQRVRERARPERLLRIVAALEYGAAPGAS